MQRSRPTLDARDRYGRRRESTYRKSSIYIYGDRSDDSEWTSLGKVKYNEDLFAGYYEGLPQVELQVELQENKNTQGYYRLVNPYAEYEGNCIENHDGHNHYIYIHAEDPQAVWVENSPIGIDFGDDYGEARVTSNVALMLEYGLSLEEAIAGSEEGIGQINLHCCNRSAA